MYIQRSSTEIQTRPQWNLIGDMTAPPTVLSPSSILPPATPRCAFISARKIRRAFQICDCCKQFFILFFFF